MLLFHIASPIIVPMTPKQLLQFFGTQQAIADCLGCAQASVSAWFAQDEVPEGRQYQVQLATNGALVADAPALRCVRSRSQEDNEKRIVQRRSLKDRRNKA